MTLQLFVDFSSQDTIFQFSYKKQLYRAKLNCSKVGTLFGKVYFCWESGNFLSRRTDQLYRAKLKFPKVGTLPPKVHSFQKWQLYLAKLIFARRSGFVDRFATLFLAFNLTRDLSRYRMVIRSPLARPIYLFSDFVKT